MTKVRAAITAVNAWVPPDLLTNHDLTKLVDTNEEWIETRTGIRERHILKGEGLGSSDMAVEAILPLLKKRGIGADEIELIICATTTPDMQFPATANIIADKIGAVNAWGYDVNAACSGFIFALSTASKFIETGTHKKVLVVGVDKMSSIIDYTDRATCVIFGDGGGAVLLEPNEEGNGIMDSILRVDGAGRAFLHQKAGGSVKPATLETVAAKEHFVYQEGQTVFKFAVTKMADVSAEIMEKNGLRAEDISWLIPHQANKRIIDATEQKLGIGPEKVVLTVDLHANTSSASIPLALDVAVKDGRIKPGHLVLLEAMGGGFTWGAALVRW